MVKDYTLKEAIKDVIIYYLTRPFRKLFYKGN